MARVACILHAGKMAMKRAPKDLTHKFLFAFIRNIFHSLFSSLVSYGHWFYCCFTAVILVVVIHKMIGYGAIPVGAILIAQLLFSIWFVCRVVAEKKSALMNVRLAVR